jgi:hypothetical protein
MVSNPQAIKGFYEGLAGKEAIPWEVWFHPLFHWAPLFIGVFGTIIALMILLRKQWVVNERLLFPLVQVPIAMIGEHESDTRSGIAPFFKSRAVWLGIAIPLILNSQRALNHYYPMVPEGIPIWRHLSFLNGAVTIPWTWNYACIGFSYLLATKLSFSLWFLGLLTIIEEVIFMRIGLASGERLIYNTSASIYPAYQGTGALIMLSLIVLWTARRRLREVLHRAWRGIPEGSDQKDVLSARSTCLLLLGSLILVGVWLGLSGIIISTVGSSLLGPTNITALGFVIPWAGEMRTSVMSAFVHGLKLSEIHVTGQRRRLVHDHLRRRHPRDGVGRQAGAG